MKKIISYLTIAALIGGIIFGFCSEEGSCGISFIGEYYVMVLKLFISPVIFTSIAGTVYETSKKKNGLIAKSVLTFTIMFVCTFIITGALVMVLKPGIGYAFDDVKWEGSTISFNLADSLLNLLPKNLNEIFVSPKVFAIIVFAWIFGRVGAIFNADRLFGGISRIKDFLFKLLDLFMYVTPVAVFSLMAYTVARYGETLLGMGLKYIGFAWGLSVIAVVLVMILPVYFISGIKPFEYIKKVQKIWVMTITTCSSAATLPYTVKLCKDEFDIDSEITDVVVPLGCTIHMCGGAVSFALLGLFSAQLYGANISFTGYLFMILAALAINMAAPGIPGGGIVIGASYLSMMGIPLGFIGFYAGIYKFLDMIYTTLNVTGDISANIILKTILSKKNI